MRILFTGGGSGGHFYPIVAVAEAVKEIVREERLLEPELYFAGPAPYDSKELFEHGITYVHVSAGKVRRYFSVLNFFDLFKTGWGILKAIVRILVIFPDVIFAKGGYGSFPTLLAARLFGIPVVIHESDSVPGRVNTWAGKFAQRVAVSFPDAADYFDSKKVALTGNPVRKELMRVAERGAYEYLKLKENLPVILVLGGSQGAKVINDTVIEALPVLTEKYNVIHQTGPSNFGDASGYARVILEASGHPERYKPFAYLDLLAMRMASGAATLVVSRAGASAIFEIASWGRPSVIVPITDSNGDHQRKNAFSYARSGAAVVVEEKNLSPHLFFSEIERLINNEQLRQKMSTSAKNFARPDAARLIAQQILDLALEHSN